MKNYKLFDIVALVTNLPKENLWAGQVGAIVEIYENGKAFEVEFVDKQGKTYGLLTLRPEQIMHLYFQPLRSETSAQFEVI